MFTAFVAAAIVQVADAPDRAELYDYPACARVDTLAATGEARYDVLADVARGACRTERTINAEEVEALLGERRFAFHADAATGLITVAARPTQGVGQAYGALNADLDEIAPGLFATEFRLARLAEAMLTFYLPPMLQSAADGLKPGGRLVIIDHDFGDRPHGPSLELLTALAAEVGLPHRADVPGYGGLNHVMVFTRDRPWTPSSTKLPAD